MTSVFVQMPAFEEAAKLPETAREINGQRVPDGVRLTKEAWVTRSEDRRGVCTTMNAAKTVAEWTVYEAPAGKLSARNNAHNHAVTHGADVIVQWDADAPPLGGGVLKALIETAAEDGVALANSTPTARDGSIWGTIVEAGSKIEDVTRPHIHGQCHAMTTEAWQAAGPFDTSLDETAIHEVRAEEEFDFRDRVAEVGEVVDVGQAKVFNDPRRSRCALPGLEDREFCQRRGEDTF